MTNIIKELIDFGILVEPEAGKVLEDLDQQSLSIILEKCKEQRPLMLTEDIIKTYLKSTSIKIIKRFEPLKTYSVQDIVEQLNKRYDFIQNLLMRKVELSNIVSINKCSNGKLSVIGIVKSKEKSNGNVVLELEDKTGTLRCVVSDDIAKDIRHDDVIAVYGNYNNNLLFGEKIMYPGVPLRKVNYSDKDTKVAFIINHDFSKDMDIKADYIIIGNCDNIEKAKEKYPMSKLYSVGLKVNDIDYISTPSLIEIDGIVILILFDHDPLEVLKKRYVSIDNTDFLIDTVPDIVLTNKDINTNYKAISIIGQKSIINLKSRDVINMTIS